MRHLYSPLPFFLFFCFGHPRRVVPQPGSVQDPAELTSPNPIPGGRRRWRQSAGASLPPSRAGWRFFPGRQNPSGFCKAVGQRCGVRPAWESRGGWRQTQQEERRGGEASPRPGRGARAPPEGAGRGAQGVCGRPGQLLPGRVPPSRQALGRGLLLPGSPWGRVPGQPGPPHARGLGSPLSTCALLLPGRPPPAPRGAGDRAPGTSTACVHAAPGGEREEQAGSYPRSPGEERHWRGSPGPPGHTCGSPEAGFSPTAGPWPRMATWPPGCLFEGWGLNNQIL